MSRFSYLHKSDRQALLTLLTVAGLILLFIYLVGGREVQPLTDTSARSDSLQSLVGTVATSDNDSLTNEANEQVTERFPFDPNTADSTELLRLGLSPRQIHNLYRYRAAGGIFQRKEDFARLYGLTVRQYEELAPYIQIARDYRPASTLLEDDNRASGRPVYGRRTGENASGRLDNDSTFVPRYPRKIAEGEHVVLNLADTTQLRTVPGIGPYYAREITRYGQRLGGYVSVDQLDEIDLFPTESKRFFVIENPQPRQLNLNQLTLEQLRRHPYINYYQARAIIDYRRQHGPITSIDELSLLPDFPPEAIDRLRPYVTF